MQWIKSKPTFSKISVDISQLGLFPSQTSTFYHQSKVAEYLNRPIPSDRDQAGTISTSKAETHKWLKTGYQNGNTYITLNIAGLFITPVIRNNWNLIISSSLILVGLYGLNCVRCSALWPLPSTALKHVHNFKHMNRPSFDLFGATHVVKAPGRIKVFSTLQTLTAWVILTSLGRIT